MKQFVFHGDQLIPGNRWSFSISPVLGVAIYYSLSRYCGPSSFGTGRKFFGVRLPDVNWSLPVALCTLVSTLLWRLKLWTPRWVSLNHRLTATPSHLSALRPVLAFTAWICITRVHRH